MANEKKNTVQTARDAAKPLLDNSELFLWDVRFEKEGGTWYLRYYIDKPGGVGIDDCENFSRAVEKICDELDFIDGSYCLEVSSPGIERELRRPEHFEWSIGDIVRLRLIRPRDGKREFIGRLIAYADKTVTIRLEDGSDFSAYESETAFVKLYYDFNGGQNR